MPLVTTAVLAYCAGLLAGFAGAVLGVLVVCILGLAGSIVRRDVRVAALGAIVAAGALIAAADDDGERTCRVRAAGAGSWIATLDAAAAPGAFVPASAASQGCTVRASIAVEHGVAPAGSRVLVRGEGVASKRGIRIQHASVRRTSGGSPLIAWRDGVGRRIDATFRADAPLVRALVINDTRSLDPAVRDRFAAAGIVHMLAISGLHVAIIAAMLEVVFVALRLPLGAALIATVAVTAFYVALIGAPPAAVRSGAMLGVVTASRLFERPTSPWASLAIGAAVPLGSARTVLDVGWQLSVLGIASLIAGARLTRRWIAPRWDGWRANLAAGALTSVVACIVTGPIVAWTFGRVSLVAPLANLAAAPVIAVLQPTLFLATLFAPLLPVARFLADAAHPMLVTFNGVASVGASLPYAAITVAPTAVGAACAGVASLTLLVACVSRYPVRPIIASLAAVACSIWMPLTPSAARDVEMHMIDVGQGDAIAIRTPHNHWLLFDAGRSWLGGDEGRSTVVPYLRRRGGDVSVFVLSHPHSDHAGGAASVMRALHPERYWDGAYVGTSETYRESLTAARDAGVRWHRARPGDSLVVDDVVITVLAPDSTWMSHLDAPNEASVVAFVRYGAVRFLLMGDAERGEEHWLLGHIDSLQADVLKVGHHGSGTSSTAEFLDAVSPRLALVSVGAGNAYGHPSANVMLALAERRAVVLRTDREGSIVIHTDGSSIEVEEGGDRWALSSRR
ncbi:MAG TPA: DNA internalization-related competence protein ComEC/Rec2 [Gemmatimonadaceae bacterium]|nr:DNA internalization-related competence protein ComEC/Rec2 [Gemmatimonadaceae bacterium]